MYETRIVGKTESGIPILRIEFDGGAWWELHAERSWGTGQAIRLATVGIDEDDEDRRFTIMKDATNLAALVGSHVAWSWPFAATAEGIRSLPEYEIMIASRELAGNHVAQMLQVDRDEKKVFSGRWSWKTPFQIIGSTLTHTTRRSRPDFTSR